MLIDAHRSGSVGRAPREAEAFRRYGLENSEAWAHTRPGLHDSVTGD
jgi:hypothetical protein